jgi:hypothetical protein
LRILFELPYPGYLRIYGSTIGLLAERGHTVLLAYDKPGKRRDPAAARVEGRAGVRVVASIPATTRRHAQAVVKLRLGTDYVRYLDRTFAESRYLRRRLDRHLPAGLRFLTHAPGNLRIARPALRALLALERLVPSDAGIEQAIAAHEPDAVVVTPLIGRSKDGIRQTDAVKAARRLGIPVGFGVASWDHLTTKGLVKVLPDRVFVWNEIQRREAIELHFVPQERVVVTGAQLFDGWFERSADYSRDDFLARLGLDRSGPYVIYVGSSFNIAPAAKEIPFVRSWLEALRRSGDPLLERLSVLVRPHPGNVEEWADVDLSALGAAIAPRQRPGLPMSGEDEALYYHSIHFASAVVGINTSAMVESFIQRRPVLTIRAPEFRETQEGTLHFRQLLSASAGALQAASTLEQHLGQLRSAVEQPERHREEIESFLRTFVRPHGLDRPATPILADAIEKLGRLRPEPAGLVRGRSRRVPVRTAAQ